MPTYRVVRKFFDESIKDEVIIEGLTLEQAQDHCNNPETSWKTATSPTAKALTEKYGEWFDAYYKEEEE